MTYSPEEKDDLLHDIDSSSEAIFIWKCHLLRAVHQDKTRAEALEWITENRAFITQDFAMKYLPRMFKETQQEWFGKRGINWHISYCILKDPTGATNILVISHLFNKAVRQTSSLVASIMNHTLCTIKEIHPGVNEARYRSDCAGSYESGGVLLPASFLGEKTGVKIDRYDFSEPQAGKGNCDRSAAHQKTHVNRYVNEGHNVTNAHEIKTALESHGGVQNCKTFVVELLSDAKEVIPAIEEVSFLHNYSYSTDGLRVWKAYQVGPGKLIPWKQFEKISVPANGLAVIEKPCELPATSVTHEKTKRVKKRTNVDISESESTSGLFCCPEDGCIKEFMSYNGLERHLSSENHVIKCHSESLQDMVKRKWVSKFTTAVITQQEPTHVELNSAQALTECDCTLDEGWALKKPRKGGRFSEKVKNYLTEKFEIGERTKQKMDPTTVSTEMRRAWDDQGMRLFKASECLNPQQIRSFFSRLAASKKKTLQNVDVFPDKNDVKEYLDECEQCEYEENIGLLKDHAISMVCHAHPLVFDIHDICALSKNREKMKRKFSKDMLRRICLHFDLITDDNEKKIKDDYMDLILQLVAGCKCSL